MVFAYMPDQAYWNFADCYDDILDNQITNPNYPVLPETLEDIGDSVVAFMNELEDDFACNGICEPGLFWFHRNVTSPPPTSNC